MPTTTFIGQRACPQCRGTGTNPNPNVIGDCPSCQGEGSINWPVDVAPAGYPPLTVMAPGDGQTVGGLYPVAGTAPPNQTVELWVIDVGNAPPGAKVDEVQSGDGGRYIFAGTVPMTPGPAEWWTRCQGKDSNHVHITVTAVDDPERATTQPVPESEG